MVNCFYKGGKAVNGERNAFSTNGARKAGLNRTKKKNSIHTFTKIKSRDHWPKCKMQNVKLLEESRRKFCDYGLVTDFFRYRKDKS